MFDQKADSLMSIIYGLRQINNEASKARNFVVNFYSMQLVDLMQSYI